MSQGFHERHSDDEEDQIASSSTHEQVQSQTDDAEFDSLLDEIDGVLEANAEEFVRSFVQKGGQ